MNDPITAAQVETLVRLLGDEWSTKARDGFLVTSGRFVDEMGGDRTEELAYLFKTDQPAGRRALRRSLEKLLDYVGNLRFFELDYPVLINDDQFGSVAVFPQLPILGIEQITPSLYRVLDSRSTVYPTGELVRDFILRNGKLPHLPRPPGLVLRKKPRIHWCSYERYDSPSDTRSALQILPGWNNDCKLRATLPTAGLEGSVFVAFNGDTEYRDKQRGEFAGYFVEVKAQDHDELPGGGLQVGVFGSPRVQTLEEWVDADNRWSTIWTGPSSLHSPAPQ